MSDKLLNNFFDISDLNSDLIYKILRYKDFKKHLVDRHIGLIFEKYSTRTRLSFKVAISLLGGNSIDIKFDELNISREESFEDTFRAMGTYLDGIVYRTDNHKKLLIASEYFKKPIINALSNKSHPCQTLGDLLTLFEIFGSLELKILWIGDMNNVCFSLIQAANILKEIELTICTPISISKDINWNLCSNVKIINEIQSIDFKNLNCVMTDVFISMNDHENNEKVSNLKNYKVTHDLMSKTPSNCVFMHCLPAKVGFEVDESVIRGDKSIIWKQAFNRMIAQKKLLHFIDW